MASTGDLADIIQAEIERKRAARIQFGTSDGLRLDTQSLGGKRALVTGGASGIGEACCRSLAHHGAHVVIADCNEEAGKTLEGELCALGLNVKFFAVDVTSWESQLRLFHDALHFLPGRELDTLITCAGTRPMAAWDMTPSSPDHLLGQQHAANLSAPSTACLDVGLIGTMYSVHIAVKYCMGLPTESASSTADEASTGKSVVLVASTTGFTYLQNKPDYTSVKWALRGLFRCLRSDLPKLGARVNLLAPTYVETPMVAPMLPVLAKKGFRLAQMEVVVDTVLCMIQDSSINGRAIWVTSEGPADVGDDIAGQDGAESVLEMYKSYSTQFVPW